MNPLRVAPLLALILFAPPAFAAWPHDPTVNVPVCTATGYAQNPVAVSDGAGGAIVAWEDNRSGVYRIFAQRIKFDGTMAWATDGIAIGGYDPTKNQNAPAICSDGAGGAIVAWQQFFGAGDYDVWTQRISPSGTLVWGSQGISTAFVGGIQSSPRVAPDGANGCFVVWQDNRSGGYDIYAQHLTNTGAIAGGIWAGGGIVICNVANDQYAPVVVADGSGGAVITWDDRRAAPNEGTYAERVNGTGAFVSGWVTPGGIFVGGNGSTATNQQGLVATPTGGAIFAWADFRSGTGDIYAEDVTGGGFVSWFLSGSPVCTQPNQQSNPVIAADGAGGAFMAWVDGRAGTGLDIYAQRMTPNGAIAAGWPVDGLQVAPYPGYQSNVSIAADGAGGLLLAWGDDRGGVRPNIWAQHLLPSGYVGTGWAYSGVQVSAAENPEGPPVIVADGTGGAIVIWVDQRNSYGNDLYAQRIERFGELGNPEPAIVNVRDVPNDQGGQVRVTWNASYLDVYPDFPISSYWLWRQVPAAMAMSALHAGARLATGDESAPPRAGERLLRAVPDGAQTIYWEYVSSQVANGFPTYSDVAPTAQDSVPAGNPRTLFMVEARGNSGGFWDSAPDSGYSVDNLGPAMPAPFAGAYQAGATHLHWGANHESDLAGYRLYRGSSSGFVPGPGNLVSAQPDTGYVDGGAAGSWYKLSAIDVHGNESPFAVLAPSGTVDVNGAPVPSVLALAAPWPNPASNAARLSFDLPRDAAVTLDLFDASGRRVRALVAANLPAGRHAAQWDGTDGSGRRAPAGLYFARLAVEGRVLERRLVLMR